MRVNLTWTKYGSSAEYGCVVFRVAGVLSCRCFLKAILHWLRGGGGAQKALALIFSHTESLSYSSRIHHILRENTFPYLFNSDFLSDKFFLHFYKLVFFLTERGQAFLCEISDVIKIVLHYVYGRNVASSASVELPSVNH